MLLLDKSQITYISTLNFSYISSICRFPFFSSSSSNKIRGKVFAVLSIKKSLISLIAKKINIILEALEHRSIDTSYKSKTYILLLIVGQPLQKN